VFLAEVFREFLAEKFVEVFTGICEFLASGYKYAEIVYLNDTFERRHRTFVKTFPNYITYKEESGFGMVYDIMYLVRLEFVEDRNNYSSISYGSKECYTPMRHVTTADCNLIARLDSAFFENDVEFLDFTSYVLILVSHSLIVCQGIHIPIFLDAFFN
jgi:hypothetical protein